MRFKTGAVDAQDPNYNPDGVDTYGDAPEADMATPSFGGQKLVYEDTTMPHTVMFDNGVTERHVPRNVNPTNAPVGEDGSY